MPQTDRPMAVRFCVISTRHISDGTAEYLNENCSQGHNGTNGGIMPYGWFLYCPEEGDEDHPADLREVTKQCREHGFEYVYLDHEGDEVTWLPILSGAATFEIVPSFDEKSVKIGL